jgi:hypothetical protein
VDIPEGALEMITVDQYFIGRKHTPDQATNALNLLSIVNPLLYEYTKQTGEEVEINKATGSVISGQTEGGFRLPDCPQGAPNSSHKQAMAVDVYDPYNHIDDWLTDEILERFGLYRENPSATKSWAHLTTRAPGSGKRTFLP